MGIDLNPADFASPQEFENAAVQALFAQQGNTESTSTSGSALTPWQDYTLQGLDPGYSYDPATQRLSTPYGGWVETPFLGPRYSDTAIPAGSVGSGLIGADEKLASAYPEYYQRLQSQGV